MLTGAEIKPVVELFILAEKQGWLDRLRYVFSEKHKILVLGSTGVGKSNFIASLSDVVTSAIHALERTDFIKKHNLKIEGVPFIFIDTPGQQHHKERRMDAVREALAHGVSGIVNVTSFGYHEYKTDKENAVPNRGQINPDYLEAHREVELAALDEWTGILGDRLTARWLLTVVSKADLWWDRQQDVTDYYEKGAYAERLGAAKSLRPSVLPYSSVVHRFFNDAPVSGMFDDSDKARLRNHLLKQLLSSVAQP